VGEEAVKPKIELHPAAWVACHKCAFEWAFRLPEDPQGGPEGTIALKMPVHVECPQCGTDHDVEYDDAWGAQPDA